MGILDKQFPIPLDNVMARLASTTVFLGAVSIRLLNWAVTGWVVVALGLSMLWLAYHMATAPDTEEVIRTPEHQKRY